MPKLGWRMLGMAMLLIGVAAPQAPAKAQAVDPERWGARFAEDMRDAIGKALSAQGITMKMPPAKQ